MKSLVIFDLNKTLINETSWYELNIALGISPEEDELLYRLGPEGEGILTYREWIAILKKIMVRRGKASREAIEKTVLDYTFADGAEETVRSLRENGHTVAIVSGGFNMVVDDVAQKLGLEHGYNNTYFVFDNDDMLEDILLTWDDDRYKPLLVQSICRKFGIHPKDTYYVADGANDSKIFEETIGIAIDPKSTHHEPWMQKALNVGESFNSKKARGKAQFEISNLRELLEIVR